MQQFLDKLVVSNSMTVPMGAVIFYCRVWWLALGVRGQQGVCAISMVGHSESMDTYGVYGHHVDGSEVVMAGMLDDAFAAVSKQSKSTA